MHSNVSPTNHDEARRLARAIVRDTSASPKAHAVARALLDVLDGKHACSCGLVFETSCPRCARYEDDGS